MGYESDGFGFESSSEQVDASLSNDSIDAGSAEITESPEQYDFDESDVGEYTPEGEPLEEDQEGSIETTELPEMSDSGSLESGEFDEDDFDEGDVGEYDPEALNENIESSDDGIEAGYTEPAEFGDSAESDFDESDVGEYDPEIVEGKIDADAEADCDNYAEHADADTVETPETSELGEDADFIEADEGTESDEENFEDTSEEVIFDGEDVEGAGEDAVFGEEINENTGEEGSDFVEDVSEDADESAESDDEGSENVGEDVESDDEANLEGEEDSDSDEELPEDAGENSEYEGESTEIIGESVESDGEENLEGEEDSDSSEELPEVTDESSDFGMESVEDADEDAESDEDDTEVADEYIESDEETSENGTESTEFGSEKPEEDSAESSDEESEAIDENAEPDDETSEAEGENAESDSEVIESTASDEENVENEEGNTEFDEEAYEGEEDNTESGEEPLEDVDEDVDSSENNLEDENTESTDESSEDADNDAESSKDVSVDENENVEPSDENSEDVDDGTESSNETTENADEATESDGQDLEGASDGADPSGESLEGDNEDIESDEENTEEVDEDIESDDESSEKIDDGSEPSEEVSEGESEDTESNNEALEDASEKTESAENILEDEDSEFCDENLENTDENAEFDEESSEGEGEGIEFNEDAPEYTGEDTESSEEKLDNVDGGTELDGDTMDETGENLEPNGEAQESTDEVAASTEEQEKRQTTDKVGEKADSDRKNEGIVPDAGQQEWHSFIGATEKEHHGGVMAMGAVASEVAAMRQEEIRQARNAETPDLHRGETFSTLREGHEQTIIAATEDRLEDRQPPEIFPRAQTEIGVEKQPERDYTDEQPEEPSVDRELEKKTVADDGTEADPDQDAAGKIAQAAQAAAAGLGPGASGGSTDGSGGSEGGSNEPGKPLSGPGEPKGASGSSGDGHSIEQAGFRVRVEIPLMNGHQLVPITVGEALQFGQPLSQLQRLVNEVPIPTNEMQGDAALADMIARLGVSPVRLGFPGNTVTMEDVRVFRKSRGLRWLRFGDRKSLILVDASNKTYVQELREVAEPNDAEHETKPEPQSKAVDALTEAVEVPPEEAERNLEIFNEIETSEYERQKQFDVHEEGLWFEGRKNLLGDYTCHGLEHVREVMSEGAQYLSALEKAGIEVPESLRRSYGVAAKYHDIGMADSAGMELSRELSEKVKQPDSDFSKLVEYYNLDPDATEESIEARRGELVAAAGKNQQKVDMVERNYELQKFILDTKTVAEQLWEMPPNDPERAEMERVYREHLSEIQDIIHSDLRSRHAYKSAEYVLSHCDEMKERYGRKVNPRNVACAVMLHTKRNSGCGDLTVLTSKASGTEDLSVEEACSKLVADWNLNHGDQRVETTFSEADLKEIATVASVLRTADNRRNGRTATFTNGDRVLCEVSREEVMVYHGREENGTVRKVRGVRSPESVKIISAESCTRFGEIRPEGSNMVHIMLFDGIGSAPLEQGFATRRIVDYVGEVESGLFKSGISEKGENGGPSAEVNIIEVHIPGASKRDCIRLEQEWRQLLANGRNQAAKQYGAAGRLRVLPIGKEEST